MTGEATLTVLWPEGWQDYELVDSGNQARLERFGPYRLARPDPSALWQPALPASEWRGADARFERGAEDAGGERGIWIKEPRVRDPWTLRYGDLRFEAQLTPFRHTGIFPEQAVNWDWCGQKIRERGGTVRVLNLFGYTGLATLASAQAGAQVTHVDASKPAMRWARKNQELSALEERPIRWLVDDALKFVKREIRRESRYDGIIMDPPAFGRGPKGEVWRFADSFPELMRLAAQLLSARPLFVLVNAYAISDSVLALRNLLAENLSHAGGTIEAGELALRESREGGRLLPTSLFARWSEEG
jgi:23S rRNA (cytosine1962-C5)-methyltransferase